MNLLILILILVQCHGVVIKLTDVNKQGVLTQSKNSLIYFFKTNCKHCKALEPIYEQLSELYENDEELQIMKINANENPILKSQFKLTSYPSIFLYNNHDKIVTKFTEGRNLINLVNFLNENTNALNKELESNVFQIKTIKEFNERKKKGNLIVISLSYLPLWEDYEFPTHFYQQLSYQHNMDFSILFIDLIDSTDFLKDYRISNYPSVIFFKSPEKFKVFKTFTKDHLNHNKLDEKSLIDFTWNLHSDDFGNWFNNIKELDEFLDQEQYEFTNQEAKGFNIRQNDRIVDEGTYEEMLNHIEL